MTTQTYFAERARYTRAYEALEHSLSKRDRDAMQTSEGAASREEAERFLREQEVCEAVIARIIELRQWRTELAFGRIRLGGLEFVGPAASPESAASA